MSSDTQNEEKENIGETSERANAGIHFGKAVLSELTKLQHIFYKQ